MRRWGPIGILLLCLILAGTTACGGDKEEASQQLVEVVRGDLTVSVSGSGNIGVSKEAKLTFGSGGKIDKIYVKEGDKVTEGEALAKLDTDALELALTQAEAALIQTQVVLQTAELNLDKAQDLYTLSDIKVAQAAVDQARRDLDEALWVWSKYEPGTPGWEDYQKVVIHAQARLDTAEDNLDAMLSGFDTEEVAIKKLQVEAAKSQLEAAGQAVAEAQKQLDEATITAPFNGVVASIDVDEGDVIPSPTMAPKIIIHLVELIIMELKVEVDEIDIPGVKLSQRAIIEVDALPALQLEGKVTSISPLGKEESGVVVYEVKISFAVPEGLGIRAGMSTEADIVINERNNVLLVPSRSIKQDSQGNQIVEVMVNEQTEERQVVIGISDGYQTEIVDGLKEGETVVER